MRRAADVAASVGLGGALRCAVGVKNLSCLPQLPHWITQFPTAPQFRCLRRNCRNSLFIVFIRTRSMADFTSPILSRVWVLTNGRLQLQANLQKGCFWLKFSLVSSQNPAYSLAQTYPNVRPSQGQLRGFARISGPDTPVNMK